MRTWKRTAAALGLVFVAGVGLTACGSGEATEADPPAATQTETQAPAEVPQADKADQPEQIEATEPDADVPAGAVDVSMGAVPFGETLNWSDGLSVTTSELKPYTPRGQVSIYAEKEYDGFGLVTVTFRNDSALPYSFVDFEARVSSAGQEGGTVTDARHDSDAEPGVDLLPGKTASFDLVLNFPDASDVTLQINRDYFDWPPAYFINY